MEKNSFFDGEIQVMQPTRIKHASNSNPNKSRIARQGAKAGASTTLAVSVKRRKSESVQPGPSPKKARNEYKLSAPVASSSKPRTHTTSTPIHMSSKLLRRTQSPDYLDLTTDHDELTPIPRLNLQSSAKGKGLAKTEDDECRIMTPAEVKEMQWMKEKKAEAEERKRKKMAARREEAEEENDFFENFVPPSLWEPIELHPEATPPPTPPRPPEPILPTFRTRKYLEWFGDRRTPSPPQPTYPRVHRLNGGAGGVNRVIQHRGHIAAVMSVLNGGENDERENPYNKAGSFRIWRPDIGRVDSDPDFPPLRAFETRENGTPWAADSIEEHISTQTAYRRVKDDHTYEYCYRSDDTFKDTQSEANAALGIWEMGRSCVNREDGAYKCDCGSCDVFQRQWKLYEFQKLYTVNSMAFHHHRKIIATSAMDHHVRFHSFGDEAKDVRPIEPDDLGRSAPHELAFGPGRYNSLLAVGARHVQLFRHPFDADRISTTLKLSSSPNLRAGAVLWGRNATADRLFASAEHLDSYQGAHKVFEIETGKTVINFDLNESGEDAALTSDGATLALCTGKRVKNKAKVAETTERGDSYVHLFDVARELRQSQSICTLERSKEGTRVEVNRASFSPDGVYLAIARSDNSVHVYDARSMGRNVVHMYRHARPSTLEEQSHFGVVQLEWVHSTTRSAYNLLSGGEDGCVRMWTPGWDGNGNGRAIARIDTDVGAFSVGDRNAGERDLVVGGSDGSVTVFDGLKDFIKVETDY